MNDKARHPSPRYFVLKSIMLNNLYGVDIMEEATEICKLRLFLKLVAQISPAKRSNLFRTSILTSELVTRWSALQMRKSFTRSSQASSISIISSDGIKSRADLADKAYERFRHMQTDEAAPVTDLSAAKVDVKTKLAELQLELDAYIAGEYGVKEGEKYQRAFRLSHQPFHWFVEFTES